MVTEAMVKDLESYRLLEEDESSLGEVYPEQKGANFFRVPCWRTILLFAILTGSMILHLLQAFKYYSVALACTCPSSSDNNSGAFSEYARLENSDIKLEWSQNSIYTSSNNTIADAAWDAINHDSGIVAVSKTWAASKDLPMGSTFPWDSSKTLYFINAYHGLHCLKNIYRAFMQYRDNVPQSLSYHHITHCLDQLRADVICTADDTPRVTTNDMRPVTGEGQWRQCRDWSKLEAWTMENPGCFRYGNPNIEDEKSTQIPRMRYCPNNSAYLPKIRAYFGKNEDWFPARDDVYSWFEES